jgi:glycosyltransferase involved in cell wall biosynthesis
MKRRLVIVTEIISPYRIPLFNALAQEEGIDPYVIFLSQTDPGLRQWRVYKDEIRFPYCVLPSWRRRIGKYNGLLNRGLSRALRSAKPDMILCGGYSYVASWQALAWARFHQVPFFLWSESCAQDQRRGHAPVEFLKGHFLRRCSGFVVPGRSAQDYLRSWGVREELIFTAPNAVDNDFFSRGAVVVQQEETRYRNELSLPERYFLFAGRLVQEKGVFDLLAAYAGLGTSVRENVGLVFAGDGAARQKLQAQALSISPGVITFAGFVHRELLPAYYALADSLVLPTYSDPWGLVVNEAMACGLPVIVSGVAGCAADLVRDQWNGILVSAGDVLSLSNAMQSIASQAGLVTTMGAHSAEHIQQYSPQAWSEGIVRAVESTPAAPRYRK